MKTVEDIYKAKRMSKERRKHFVNIILSFDEAFIKEQRNDLKDKIKVYKSRLTEKDEQKVNEAINEELKHLRKQLTGLNYILK